jgi:transcriptional regulator with XRE-family HTH domain
MSSPFAVFLRDLRLRNNFRQHELAEQLGYEQAYISALELGTRGPSKELLDALIKKMSLSDKDQVALSKAIGESGRRFVLPAEAQTDTYRFCHELWEKIGDLHPAVIQAMRELVRLEDVMSDQPRSPLYRRRHRSTKQGEAEM